MISKVTPLRCRRSGVLRLHSLAPCSPSCPGSTESAEISCDAIAQSGEARLVPLVRLRARLRAEVGKLKGEELKTKERRLRLVETTMELLQWLLAKGPAAGACAEVGERVPQAAQASCWVGRRPEERLKM
jgi:hypothetical protein